MAIGPTSLLYIALAAMLLTNPGGSASAGPVDPPNPNDVARARGAPRVVPLTREGLLALQTGSLDTAEQKFTAAAKIDPDSANPKLGLAEVALRRGDPAGAETLIRSAVARAPRSVLARAALARLLVGKNDPAGAVAEFDVAIALNPSDPTLPVERGDVLSLALDRQADAIRSYRQAIAVDANYAPAHFELGRVLSGANRLGEARPELLAATRLAPGSAPAWSALGDVQLRMGDPAAGAAAFDVALKIAPDLAIAQLGRGDALAALGRTDEALAAYNVAGAGTGASGVALVRRGALQQRLGHVAAAITDFRAAVALNANDPDAQNDLAYTLAEAKQDLDAALAAATTAVRLAPGALSYRDTLAWVYRARGDLPAALAILQPLAASTEDPGVDVHLGTVYRALGRKADAAAAFGAALRLDPRYKPALDAMR